MSSSDPRELTLEERAAIERRLRDDEGRVRLWRFSLGLPPLEVRASSPAPDARNVAWDAWVASWQNEPGDEEAFVAWWESYLRTTKPEELPLDAAVASSPVPEDGPGSVWHREGLSAPRAVPVSVGDDERKNGGS